MLTYSSVFDQPCKLPLLPALSRGNQKILPIRDFDESNYTSVIQREAKFVMLNHSLQPIKGPISMVITVHSNQVHDDPVLIVKLIMDALNGVCYSDDSDVYEVTYKQKNIPLKKNGYVVKPYVEINCGRLPVITVWGNARGKRYPLYGEQDLKRLAHEHDLIRQQVMSITAPHVKHIVSPYGDMDVSMVINQNQLKGDIDNISLNYWPIIKDLINIENNQVRSLNIKRSNPQRPTEDWFTINVQRYC
jgi:hypothetical protein